MAVRICCLTPRGCKTSPRTQLLMAQDPQADGKSLFWQQTTHFVHEKQQHSYCRRPKYGFLHLPSNGQSTDRTDKTRALTQQPHLPCSHRLSPRSHHGPGCSQIGMLADRDARDPGLHDQARVLLTGDFSMPSPLLQL